MNTSIWHHLLAPISVSAFEVEDRHLTCWMNFFLFFSITGSNVGTMQVTVVISYEAAGGGIDADSALPSLRRLI
jgi:hypothetical protein